MDLKNINCLKKLVQDKFDKYHINMIQDIVPDLIIKLFVNYTIWFQLFGVLLSFYLGLISGAFVINKLRATLSSKLKVEWVSKIVEPIVKFGCFMSWFLVIFFLFSLVSSDNSFLLLCFQGSFFFLCFLLLLQITKSYLISGLITVVGLVPWMSLYIDKLNILLEKINLFYIQVGNIKLTPLVLFKGLLLLLILGWMSSHAVELSTGFIKKNRKLKSNTKALLSKSIELSIYFITILVGFSVLGIDLTVLTVIGGALGVGIGLGLQKITSNFISGIILLLEKSIETDDLIEMDNGIYGFVRSIRARFTLIETFDGKEIMVPNEDFITQRVTNWTYTNTKGRIEIFIGVSYKSDLKLAYELILEAAKEHPLCIKDPKPECFLREFDDSSVKFLLYFFIEDVTKGRYQTQSEVMFLIWDKFKTHHIEIPFPQRDIYIKSGELK